jgi:hypothetical protein
MGEARKHRFGMQLFLGLGASLVILVADTILASTLTTLFPHGHAEGFRGLDALLKNPWNLPVLFLSVVSGGGGVEELTRVFILTRFRNTWGRTGLIIGMLVEPDFRLWMILPAAEDEEKIASRQVDQAQGQRFRAYPECRFRSGPIDERGDDDSGHHQGR